ncbi:hypothetical protein D0X99_15130 [Algoriphagus lacus]|uniref:Uncharacterized protein n=1 Tax=Algoriphagus lacus TaxID=2056311 RepID=A0A418PNM2_9BACT|nr:hypothetical protein D0X99_15130 [Algoriphagus lacus]
MPRGSIAFLLSSEISKGIGGTGHFFWTKCADSVITSSSTIEFTLLAQNINRIGAQGKTNCKETAHWAVLGLGQPAGWAASPPRLSD